ncbi:MAG TPA: hypothetical protein VEZ55_00435 [Chitinophagaceae bacterium]|jgi:hypothetical protein|nr:hypothetical protein [Chitinophagaceae bacterium]
MTPDRLFTQAGRVFHFIIQDKKVACNYYFTRSSAHSINSKLWMNVLIHFGERKDVYELVIEQPESAITLRPKTLLDDKVQKLVEAYLLHLL